MAIDRHIIEVEQIAAAGAGRALQTNRSGLDWIEGSGIGRDPILAPVVSRGDVQVPDVFAIQGGAVGIAGSVFTTGVALNIDTVHDSTRFNEAFDKKLGFETRSIICHPIHNREDKIIGVIEVLNKRNEDRFTIEDEKIMKVLSLIFSSVFYNFTPMSEKSTIRRFSGPFDRKNALIGRVPHVASLRSTIVKLKDIEAPVLIYGEKGVGKSLYAKILHVEGQRGLKPFEVIYCEDKDQEAVAISAVIG